MITGWWNRTVGRRNAGKRKAGGSLRRHCRSLRCEPLESRQLLSAEPILTIGDVAQLEGNVATTAFVFNLQLSQISLTPVSVFYSTVDDTATAGTDYQGATNQVLNIPPSTTTAQIIVQVLGNTTPQPDRDFFVVLNSPSGVTLGNDQATGTIVDDDGTGALPILTVADVQQTEGTSGSTSFVFNVSLSASAPQDVTFAYSTSDGTAVAGTDYTATTGNGTIAAGQQSTTVTVPVLGDTVPESSEVFFLDLNTIVGAAPSQASATGTILDNALATPALSISDVSQALNVQGTTPFVFDVTLSAAAAQTVTVTYATADGSAVAGVDYQAGSNIVTIPAGQTSATVTIAALGNTPPAANKTFFVDLVAPSGASIAKARGIGTILNTGPTGPTVTINQAAGQSDPTSASLVQFTAVFSTSVTGFDASDVDLTGSTAPGPLQAAVSGSGATYQVTVSGMTGSGAVVASIPAGKAINGQGLGNSASTSTDHSVTYQFATATRIGVYDPLSAHFYLALKNSSNLLPGDLLNFGFNLNLPGWPPLAGDWNNDGTDTIALFDPSTAHFYLKDSNTNTGNDVNSFGFAFNATGWTPLAGDWNNDGTDTIGLFDPSTAHFYLKNSNTNTGSDVLSFGFNFNAAGWLPVAGDWNGDGTDTIGLYDPSTAHFYLKDSNSIAGNDVVSFAYNFNSSGWSALAGDWFHQGKDTIGLYNPFSPHFYLVSDNSATPAVVNSFGYETAGIPSTWPPVVGNWTGAAGPLLAADGPGNAATATAISTVDLQPIVAQAIQQWTATGLTAQQQQLLQSARVVLGDLTGGELGEATGSSVTIDRRAAGHGWFVDPTPADSSEFAPSTPGRVDPQVVDRMDLLTVVSHELGHVLGKGDLDAADGNVMDASLRTGVRRLPGAQETDAILAGGTW